MVAQRIVVADKQLLFAHALCEALRTSGHHIVAACTTRSEVVSALQSSDVTLCLIDPRLADGLIEDFLMDLAAMSPDCRIVVLTDDARPEVLQSAVRAGAAGYLQKSRSLPVVLDALTRVGRGEVVIEASLLAEGAARLVDSARPRQVWPELTKRELQCLQLIVEGKDTTAIAHELGVSRTTVRSHVQAVLNKLGVHSRLEAVAFAARGLIVDWPGERAQRTSYPRTYRTAR